ncbi:hypothetical protein OROMI_020966 [Orobanche minor]
MVMELLNYIKMEALILAIDTHPISQFSIFLSSLLFFNSKNKCMARKVKKTSTVANSSRKQNGGRSPIVEDASSPICETDEQNHDLQVRDDDDASRNEGSGTHPNSFAPSQGQDENPNYEYDEFGELHRTRGPNRGMDVPEDLDDRPTILTVGDRFPDTRLTSDIVVTIKENFEDTWATWRKAPQDITNLYWDKFKKHFKWMETYETLIEQKYPDPESCPNFDVTIWKDAAGGAKGSRLYVFGNTRQTLEYERDGADVEGSS